MRAVLLVLLLSLISCEIQVPGQGDVKGNDDPVCNIIMDGPWWMWGSDERVSESFVMHFIDNEYKAFFLNEIKDTRFDLYEVLYTNTYDECNYNYDEDKTLVESIRLLKGEVGEYSVPTYINSLAIKFDKEEFRIVTEITNNYFLRDNKEVVPATNNYNSVHLYADEVFVSNKGLELEMEFSIYSPSFEISVSDQLTLDDFEGFDVTITKIDSHTLKIMPLTGAEYGAIKLKLGREKLDHNTWSSLSFKKCNGLLKCNNTNNYDTTKWKFINLASEGVNNE